ncbi:MAG: hypothetical protein SGI98_00790 [Verrucomicrobiota bacterium]|nr:hypothetical protein [Verrucomicrobiota bacterium]
MDFMGSFGWAEWLLVIVVTLQVAAISYTYSPRWKAFIYALPIPFSVGLFVVNQPINATNVLGLLLLLAYIHLIRLFHISWRWNITVSIIVSAVFYIVAGSVINPLLPDNQTTFLIALATTAGIAAIMMQVHPHRDEPGHKTTLPIYIKIPVIVVIVAILVGMKQTLGGFMTTFPLVGILGAYESRHSLWTMSRQFPRMILCILALIVVTRFAGHVMPLPFALVIGWLVALPLLWKISVKDMHALDTKNLANEPESDKGNN